MLIDITVPTEEVIDMKATTPRNAEKKKKIHVCFACSNVLSTYTNMKLHLKIHSSGKLFNCDIHQKTFERKSSLLRYFLTHNNSEHCTLKCSKVFIRRDNLRQHLRLHQNSSHCWCCSDCDQGFDENLN